MTMNREQIARAQRFHQLHNEPRPLVLANAWDAASVRIVEEAGAQAIGTTSAGMAWTQGYSDGEQMPVHELLAACQRICRTASTPVSVDIERGYGRDAKDTGGLVGALMQLGVVGINIEDGTDPGTHTLAHPSILTRRIACARDMARHHGLPLFINARIDTYVATGTETAARLEETRQRALAYIDAGADGIFVPGLADLGDIAHLARALPVPLNIYAGYPGAPSVEALQRAGARRISLGCGPMQAVMAHLARIAAEAFTEGRYDTMAAHMLTPAQANALFPSTPVRDDGTTRRVLATGMGDGPVGLLFARPRHSVQQNGARLSEVELTTRNGMHKTTVPSVARGGARPWLAQPTLRRLAASFLGAFGGTRADGR
jgi:2-methylisocitrate lyase-like PEP mutase family enzyme